MNITTTLHWTSRHLLGYYLDFLRDANAQYLISYITVKMLEADQFYHHIHVPTELWHHRRWTSWEKCNGQWNSIQIECMGEHSRGHQNLKIGNRCPKKLLYCRVKRGTLYVHHCLECHWRYLKSKMVPSISFERTGMDVKKKYLYRMHSSQKSQKYCLAIDFSAQTSANVNVN